MRTRWAALALLLLLAPEALGRADELTPGERGFVLDLEDQYGDPVAYPPPAERLDSDGEVPVTLVLAAGRRGRADRSAWIEPVKERYAEHLGRRALPGLEILAVAHLAGIPPPFRALVTQRYFLAGPGEPRRTPVGLDWQGQVAGQLGYEPGVANLAVFDREGTLRLRLAARPEPERLEELFGALDELLVP